jgi:hypothetical protein
MRRSLTIATGFLLAFAAPSLASNVLLPSPNSTPSLGLSPSTSAAPATAPAAQTPPAAEAPAAVAPAPAATTAIPPDLANAPQSQAAAPNLTQYKDTPIDQVSAAGLPPGTIPTQVIQEPESTDELTLVTKNLPYGLAISITNQSVFGGQDVESITSKLGLTRTQIPSSCVLAPRGIMQTTKGDYIITGRATQQTFIKYDGTIKDLMLNTSALCVVNGHLPPGSGVLEKTGNYFSIPLQMFKCPLPTRQATQLNITYTGSENARCVYQ